jgi:hypothetical protein
VSHLHILQSYTPTFYRELSVSVSDCKLCELSLQTECVDIFVLLINLQSDQRTTLPFVRSDSRKNDCLLLCLGDACDVTAACCVETVLQYCCVTSSRCLPAVVAMPTAWRADRCLATRNNIRNSLVAYVYSVTGGCYLATLHNINETVVQCIITRNYKYIYIYVYIYTHTHTKLVS